MKMCAFDYLMMKCAFITHQYNIGILQVDKIQHQQVCPGLQKPVKVARSNHQKHTFTTGGVGTFLLIAACHLDGFP